MPTHSWNAENQSEFESLIARSNVLGKDDTICSVLDGCTSAKFTETDYLDQSVTVMTIAAPHSNLAELTQDGCSLLTLEPMMTLLGGKARTDAEINTLLDRFVFEGQRPRQSIEALLHAAVPSAHVDHTHPTALLAIACSANPADLIKQIYGERVAYIPCAYPNWSVVEAVKLQVAASTDLEAICLGRQGLLTWGDTAQACYDKTIVLIQEAEDFIVGQGAQQQPFGEASHRPEQQDLMFEILPLVRKVATGESSIILHYDDNPALLEAFNAGNPLAVDGVPTANHASLLGWKSLVVDWQPEQEIESLKEKIEESLASYKEEAPPRVILIPDVVVIIVGDNIRDAKANHRLLCQSLNVIATSQALGGYVPLGVEAGQAAVSEQAVVMKLNSSETSGDFAGKIALVTGSASGIGRATAYNLVSKGCHVAILDINVEGGEAVAADLQDKYGEGCALFIRTDVSSEDVVQNTVQQMVITYGGLDVLVNNAGISDTAPLVDTTMKMYNRNVDVLLKGYFLMARESVRVLTKQEMGGVLVFVGSKNSIAPATTSSVYSAAKAGEIHMARCLAEELGPDSIRVNSVLPDGVVVGSNIWAGGHGERRAAQHGISVEDLPEFYRQRNTLKVSILPEDVADAIVFLAGPHSQKITGAVLTVDGGVAIGYVR